MKSRLRRVFSFVTAVILLISAVPFTLTANAATFNQIVNAATYIIVCNEGNYATVVRDDRGALSIGVIGWHATNALNLLKEIVAANPSQALNILGSNLYNEIITSTYWETKIPTKEEAAAISILISTTEGRQIQDRSAAEYISSYVRHGQQLGITEPEALVFFADFQNQNGYTGAESFFRTVRNAHGTVNLGTLYESSSKNTRRTRTYNFCADINWNNYTNIIHGAGDSSIPVISNVTLTGLSATGYTISCDVQDDRAVTAVYFAVYPELTGEDSAKWYQQTPVDGKASHTVDISEFSNRSGRYYTVIYAFDESGNYAYVQLNAITVPDASELIPKFTIAISSEGGTQKGENIRWTATASNGSGSYLYEFNLYMDGKHIDRRAANDFSAYEYTPEESGVYKVTVTVTDTVSGEILTADSPEVNLFEPVVTGDFKATESKTAPGQPLTWNLTASGGEGELKYSYTVYRNDVAIKSTDWTTSQSHSHKAAECGVYYVVANIMDSRNQTVSVKSEEVIVSTPLSAENLSFSDSYAVTGKSVNVSADVSGGTGRYTCSFIIYCNGIEVLNTQITDSSEFTFTVTQAGIYTASVTVTNEDSTITLTSESEMKAEENAVRGDANCDGLISASDARYVLRCSAMLETPDEGLRYAADVNEDDKITATDARMILRISAQLEN